MIGFAHRGAPRSRSGENTIEAFGRALALGATGLESDVALTADGDPVLIHPHLFRRGPNVSRLHRAELPAHIPALSDLYSRCGTGFELALDMAQPTAVDAVVSLADRYQALDRLWLTYWHLRILENWRSRWPRVRLVYACMPVYGRSARLVRRLAQAHVDAINVHHRFCTARLIADAHEAGIGVFAWGVRSRRPLARVAVLGVDGVFCDNVAEMSNLIRAKVERQT